jgi:hypothetical protein
MKPFAFFFAKIFLFTACNHLPFHSLTSTTTINGNDAFILGNNKHGQFFVRLNNTSNSEITVRQVPIAGGQHPPLKLRAKQNVLIKVDRNTALRIENPSSATIAVELKVTGSTGLSMGYKN